MPKQDFDTTPFYKLLLWPVMDLPYLVLFFGDPGSWGGSLFAYLLIQPWVTCIATYLKEHCSSLCTYAWVDNGVCAYEVRVFGLSVQSMCEFTYREVFVWCVLLHNPVTACVIGECSFLCTRACVSPRSLKVADRAVCYSQQCESSSGLFPIISSARVQAIALFT